MSIDHIHQQKILQLSENKKHIQQLETKIKNFEKDKCKDSDIFTSLQIDDDIYNLKERINTLKNETSNEYLLKISSVLSNYNKSFQPDIGFSKISEMNNIGEGTICNFVEKKTKNKRGQLLNSYMNIVEGNCVYKPTTQPSINTDGVHCTDCNVPMRLSMNESYVVCSNCGNYNEYFEPSMSGLTYEQELNTDTNAHFAYKRINHLRELLAQLQAKERSEIPSEVIDKVQAEFKKARIQNVSEITETKVKQYLKKLNLNKYYEHTRQITNLLNGKPPPCISSELYETLINMFMEIQEPFDRVCPVNRKNFFSYNYVLYKFCELLGETEMMSLFPLLKSREKLYQQDCIWKEICRITEWTFYKSV